MKNEAIISLGVFLLLATLVTESNCFSGPFPGKRELKAEVGYCCKRSFFSVFHAALGRNEGMKVL